jgi:vancomycin resistance protein YoaR
MTRVRKAGLLLALCMVMLAAVNTFATEKTNDTIKEGIYIDNIDVSNMSSSEAKKSVKKVVNDRTDTKVTIKVNKNTVETTLKELGYRWTNKTVLNEAMQVGKTGNVIKRYKDSIDLKRDGKTFELKMNLNKKVLKAKLKELCDQYNVPAKNASLKATGHGFQIIPEEEGCVLDYKTTVKELLEYVDNSWDKESEISIEATTKVSKPKYTTEDCEKVSNEPMGTYTTYFTSGVVNRNTNIKNGAEKLSDNILYPGESFSCNEHLVPWTEDNGWLPAGTYSDGSVVDSLGGGICQVSSTLYNALLDAEIKVTERYPHSMAVSYVPLSADAALAGDYKDLVFENNTDAPIYIQGIYTDGSITFNIYGHDTRKKGHSVEYVSKTIKTIPIKTVKKKDATKPVGYSETTQGHVGYVAELYKVTYENGKEVSRELMHTSTYAMSPTTTIVGTKKSSSASDKSNSEEETTTKKAN